MFSILSNKTKISLLVMATFALSIVAAIFGQVTTQPNDRMWNFIEERSLDQTAQRLLVPHLYRTVRLDRAALQQALSAAPMEFTRDAANLAQPFECEFNETELPPSPDAVGGPPPAVTSGTQLRTYRLALAATNEYCVAVGGNTVSGSLAAEVLIMNRVNGVYERDVAIHMNIIATNN